MMATSLTSLLKVFYLSRFVGTRYEAHLPYNLCPWMYSVVFVYYCMLAIALVQLSDNSIEIIKLDQMSLLAAISFSGLCYAIRSITIPSVSFSCCKRFLLIILCTAYLTRRSFACATVLWESSASYFSVSFCAVGAVATFALLAAIPCLWIHSNFESVWISQSFNAG